LQVLHQARVTMMTTKRKTRKGRGKGKKKKRRRKELEKKKKKTKIVQKTIRWMGLRGVVVRIK